MSAELPEYVYHRQGANEAALSILIPEDERGDHEARVQVLLAINAMREVIEEARAMRAGSVAIGRSGRAPASSGRAPSELPHTPRKMETITKP